LGCKYRQLPTLRALLIGRKARGVRIRIIIIGRKPLTRVWIGSGGFFLCDTLIGSQLLCQAHAGLEDDECDLESARSNNSWVSSWRSPVFNLKMRAPWERGANRNWGCLGGRLRVHR
jgi:hypothetical protein